MNKTYLRRSPWACGQFDSLTNETSATKLKYYNWTWAELEYPMLGSKNGIIERHKYMVLGTMGLCDPNQFKTKARFFFFFFFSPKLYGQSLYCSKKLTKPKNIFSSIMASLTKPGSCTKGIQLVEKGIKDIPFKF